MDSQTRDQLPQPDTSKQSQLVDQSRKPNMTSGHPPILVAQESNETAGQNITPSNYSNSDVLSFVGISVAACLIVAALWYGFCYIFDKKKENNPAEVNGLKDYYREARQLEELSVNEWFSSHFLK